MWISLIGFHDEDPTSSFIINSIDNNKEWFILTFASLLKQRVEFWLLGLQFKLNVQCTWRIFQWMPTHVLWNLAAVSMGMEVHVLGQ